MVLKLRSDFDASELRRLARQSDDANQARRLLSPALVYDGHSRTEAAKTGGVGLQIVRDWVVRFNAEGPDGLKNHWAGGSEAKLDQAQLEALARMVETGPIASIHGVVRWRLVDLAGWLFDEYGVTLSESRLSRILNGLGYRKLSARPKHHEQNAYALEDFKKSSPPAWRKSDKASPVEPR